MENRNNQESWVALAAELDTIIKERKRIQMHEKELLDRLIKESNELPSWGADYKLITIERKGSVNYKAVAEIELPSDYDFEAYRSDSKSYWKFSNL